LFHETNAEPEGHFDFFEYFRTCELFE